MTPGIAVRTTAPSSAIEEELTELLKLVSRPLDETRIASHLAEVAQRVVDGLRRLLGVAGCRLLAVDAVGGASLQQLAASPTGENPDRPAGDVATRALQERRIVGALDDELLLAVPLPGGDRPSGVLEVRRSHGVWSREELRLVRLFAAQAAVAMETARLATESRQRRRTDEALALMAHATSHAFDVSTLGREIVETLLVLLGCARAALYELAGSGVRLIAVARVDGGEARDDVTESELGPVEARALRHRRVAATADLLAELGARPAEIEPASLPRIRSIVAIPLLHDDAPIGMLSVGDRVPRVFEPEELEVFRAAADHAAVTLEHARRHARTADAVRVRERVRIANELHDTLGQLAFSVGLKLDWCLHRTAQTSPVLPKLEELRHDTGLMMARIRQLLGHLSLEGPAEASVTSRVERLARDVQDLTGTSVDLRLRGDPASLSTASADVLEKTLQEALVNIAKHARARHARVRIDIRDGRTSIEVRDDGVGMAIGAADVEHAQRGHFGLRQMRERIEALGGRLEVAGHPGTGVCLRGTFPSPPEGA
jgi:signal transduction histidine kinase